MVGALCGLGAFMAGGAAFAQRPVKIRRIGFLATRFRSTPSNPDVFYDAFVLGMRELGYVDGKNMVIDWRFAEGRPERLPGLVDELVRIPVDVIVTHSTPGTRAAQRATSTIPIVIASVSDPVRMGFAASLARPGGNITGLSMTSVDLGPKYVELLKTLLPRLSRIAFAMNPDTQSHHAILKSVQSAAQGIGIKVLPLAARDEQEVRRSLDAMVRERVEAAIVAPDTFIIGQRAHFADLALEHRMPTMFAVREQVTAGGLMSYGQDIVAHYRHAALYVDKIIKGAKPSDLPIEQPTKLHLAINAKTAKALGLTIPGELLLRADEVIE